MIYLNLLMYRYSIIVLSYVQVMVHAAMGGKGSLTKEYIAPSSGRRATSGPGFVENAPTTQILLGILCLIYKMTQAGYRGKCAGVTYSAQG